MGRSIVIAVIAYLIFAGALITMGAVPVSASDGTGLEVNGDSININGETVSELTGVCDTTVLQYAILAFLENSTELSGMNENFPGPEGTLDCSSPDDLWGQYFTLCEFYGLDLIRIGAGDAWGTDIQYEAWVHHHDPYIDLLESMARHAEAHGRYVVLVLAGTQSYPGPSFGTWDDCHDTSSEAYANYIAYARDTMTELGDEPGIGLYDMWDRPDNDDAYTWYWSVNGDAAAYSTWAGQIALDTADCALHPRMIGTQGFGHMFRWGQEDFDMATGPFEVCGHCLYPSDGTDMISEPGSWADEAGKPLIWLGDSSSKASILISTSLNGTDGYPYTKAVHDSIPFVSEDIEEDPVPGDPVEEVMEGEIDEIIPSDGTFLDETYWHPGIVKSGSPGRTIPEMTVGSGTADKVLLLAFPAVPIALSGLMILRRRRDEA